MRAKKARAKIRPEVQLKLWVLSGGRCEFPGCNKQVWRDGLTLKEDNFAHMAHNIAASPDGPRGDKIHSPKRVTDYSNLLLLCTTHSKLVDGKHKHEYTVEMLSEYKRRHEERIRIQTDVGPEMGTTVMRFVAPIRERRMSVSSGQAYAAISPRFPADPKGISIDYSSFESGNTQSYWSSVAKDIDSKVKNALATGNDHQRVEHLSVFAIAPIPLLVYLGNRIGGTMPTDIYQKHRDTDDWKWQKEIRNDPFAYVTNKSARKKRAKRVALMLSLSGRVDSAEVRKVTDGAPWYEITISNPDRDYLKRRSQLTKFAEAYRTVLTEIRTLYGGDAEIWLFPAIPVSIAVACGRELLPKSDPHLVVFDNMNDKGGFVRTLKIN